MGFFYMQRLKKVDILMGFTHAKKSFLFLYYIERIPFIEQNCKYFFPKMFESNNIAIPSFIYKNQPNIGICYANLVAQMGALNALGPPTQDPH